MNISSNLPVSPNIRSMNNNSASIGGMSYLFGNLFQFLSVIGPYVLIGFFILTSIFNSNLKGFVYALGILILIAVSTILSGYFPINSTSQKSICKMFGLNLINSNSIPFSTLIYFYTFAYLFIPMFKFNVINYSVLLSIILLASADAIVIMNNMCANIVGVLYAVVVGFLLGMTIVLMFHSINPDILYHTDFVSDKVACSMPSQQNFKCKVYKNGELITTMTK